MEQFIIIKEISTGLKDCYTSDTEIKERNMIPANMLLLEGHPEKNNEKASVYLKMVLLAFQSDLRLSW